jgi:hypothetical protein
MKLIGFIQVKTSLGALIHYYSPAVSSSMRHASRLTLRGEKFGGAEFSRASEKQSAVSLRASVTNFHSVFTQDKYFSFTTFI